MRLTSRKDCSATKVGSLGWYTHRGSWNVCDFTLGGPRFTVGGAHIAVFAMFAKRIEWFFFKRGSLTDRKTLSVATKLRFWWRCHWRLKSTPRDAAFPGAIAPIHRYSSRVYNRSRPRAAVVGKVATVPGMCRGPSAHNPRHKGNVVARIFRIPALG